MSKQNTRKDSRPKGRTSSSSNVGKALPTHPSAPKSSPPKSRRTKTTSSHQGISSGAMKAGTSNISVGSRGSLGQSLRVSGSEYLGTVISGTADASGTVLTSRLNVAGPTSTRLAQFASIYERWHAIKYTYRFTSSLPTSTPGTFIMAQDPDPTADYTSGDVSNVARWRTLPGSVMLQAWQNASCSLPTTSDYTSLWTADNDIKTITEEDRLDMAGRLWFGLVAPTGTESPTAVYGILELDYTIEFYSPKLALGVIERAAEFFLNAERVKSMFGTMPAANVNILDTVFSWLKSNVVGIASNAFTTLLKSYVNLAGDELRDKNPDASVQEGLVGFLPSVISYEFIMASLDEHKAATDLPFQTITHPSWGASFADNYDSSTLWDTVFSWTGPDGYTWPYSYHLGLTFGVDQSRGLAECKAAVYDPSKINTSGRDAFYLLVKVAGSHVFIEIAANGRAIRRVKPRVKSSPFPLPNDSIVKESKEEKLVPTELSPTPSWTDTSRYISLNQTSSPSILHSHSLPSLKTLDPQLKHAKR